MASPNQPRPKGRGAPVSPPNRFETARLEDDLEQLQHSEPPPGRVATEFFADSSQSVICKNNSPDIPFRYSINPYRGCEHGCAYCYARPGHELLGMNAGIDFESKVLVKRDAAKLLRRELASKSWRGEPIAVSGVTDCYQPAERCFRITRSLLEVMAEANQAVTLITKNALVLRDLDLLAPMAARKLVHVGVSLTTLDASLARTLEPRTSSPEARLRCIRELSAAGVPVRAMTAPVIPGLNDEEIPQLLAAAKEAGAVSASYILLRLPWAVAPVFLEWLDAHRPLARAKVESLIRASREGALNDSQWGKRMRGDGAYAESIRQTFAVFARKHGLDQPSPPLDTTQFRPPTVGGQRMLF
ncbi:MAG: PA0069 family radical SAM protein [Pirellulaceae bacterium]